MRVDPWPATKMTLEVRNDNKTVAMFPTFCLSLLAQQLCAFSHPCHESEVFFAHFDAVGCLGGLGSRTAFQSLYMFILGAALADRKCIVKIAKKLTKKPDASCFAGNKQMLATLISLNGGVT